MSVELARQVLTTEAEAILRLRDHLDASFEKALDLLAACQGRVVWTGMGKSGIICRKAAATMTSTGTPSMFLHPAEAIHGDLGMLAAGDVVIALSNSGETDELLNLVDYLKRLGTPLIAITSNPASPLAGHADIHIDLGVTREACPNNLAPTASTTAALALGDAMAMALVLRKGFQPQDFARLHPGGKLGKRLMTVEELMHKGDKVPRVAPDTAMKDVIYEMSRKGLGITTVQDPEGHLLGVITDGDLRRLMETDPDPLRHTAGQVLHAGGVTIESTALATAALSLLERRRITSVVVTDEARQRPRHAPPARPLGRRAVLAPTPHPGDRGQGPPPRPRACVSCCPLLSPVPWARAGGRSHEAVGAEGGAVVPESRQQAWPTDGNDVEAARHVPQVPGRQVDAGKTYELLLLAAVHRLFRRPRPLAATGLDLHEHAQPAPACHEVDLPVPAAPVTCLDRRTHAAASTRRPASRRAVPAAAAPLPAHRTSA